MNFPVLRDTPAHLGAAFARGEGIEGSGIEALAALRALPATKVCGGLNFGTVMMGGKGAETYVGPGYDGWTVSADPAVALRDRRAANVPIMIGTTSQDVAVTFPESRADPLAFFGGEAAAARAAYDPDNKLKAPALYLAVGEDLTMQEPARFVAKQMTAAGNAVWLYRFGYVAESARSQGSSRPARQRTAVRVRHSLGSLSRRGDGPRSDDGARLPRLRGPVREERRPEWVSPSHMEPLRPGPRRPDDVHADGGPAMEADPRKARLDLVERALDAFDGSQAGLSGSTWQLVRIQEGGRTPLSRPTLPSTSSPSAGTERCLRESTATAA